MSDVQDDVFYEVLTDALNISDGATISRLDPERRRLVVGLNGFVAELAMWTGTDPAVVKEHLPTVSPMVSCGNSPPAPRPRSLRRCRFRPGTIVLARPVV